MNINIHEIAEHWGLKNVKIIEKINVQGNRLVWKIKTNNCVFILKGYDILCDKKNINNNTLILIQLSQHTKKVAPILYRTINNENFLTLRNRHYYLMEYIEGRILSETPEDEFILGKALSEFHSINTTSVISELDFIERRNNMYNRFNDFYFKAEYDKIIDSLPDFNKYTQCLIHTDVSPKNAIISKSGNIIFIDLDDCGEGSKYIDLGYPLITQFIRFDKNGKLKFNIKNAQAFYAGYFYKNNMVLDEPKLIYYGAIFMQLMYMPCFGNENVPAMWKILKYGIDNKDTLLNAIIKANSKITSSN